MKFELKASPVLFFSRAKSEGGGRSRWWCVGSVGVRTHWAVRQIAGLVGEKRLSKRMRDQWTRTSDGILSALTKGYVLMYKFRQVVCSVQSFQSADLTKRIGQNLCTLFWIFFAISVLNC